MISHGEVELPADVRGCLEYAYSIFKLIPLMHHPLDVEVAELLIAGEHIMDKVALIT
jgi:hypothetical protein